MQQQQQKTGTGPRSGKKNSYGRDVLEIHFIQEKYIRKKATKKADKNETSVFILFTNGTHENI